MWISKFRTNWYVVIVIEQNIAQSVSSWASWNDNILPRTRDVAVPKFKPQIWTSPGKSVWLKVLMRMMSLCTSSIVLWQTILWLTSQVKEIWLVDLDLTARLFTVDTLSIEEKHIIIVVWTVWKLCYKHMAEQVWCMHGQSWFLSHWVYRSPPHHHNGHSSSCCSSPS